MVFHEAPQATWDPTDMIELQCIRPTDTHSSIARGSFLEASTTHTMNAIAVLLLVVPAGGFVALGPRHASMHHLRISMRISAPPPEGFVWADDAVESPPAASTAAPVAMEASAAVDASAAAPVATAPNAVEAPVAAPAATKPRASPAKSRQPSSQGLFAPVVKGAKAVMGEKELNKLRGEVIAQHTKVISAFVDTSESKFGQIVLKRMFEAADKDGNGTLDKEEVREALHALGFKFLQEKQVDGILARADVDGNEVIDFAEFVKDAPKTLRTGLVKLAKQNGHDLGFLA